MILDEVTFHFTQMTCRQIFYPFPNPYFRCGFIGRKPHPKSKFTPEEDAQLKELVDLYGDDWNLIANKMVSRNPRQCRDRYMNYLSPTVNSSPWTPEDDIKLQQLHLEYGPKWVKISRHFQNRTDTNIKNRWMVLQRQQRSRKETEQRVPFQPPQVVQIPQAPEPREEKPNYDDMFEAEVETDLWDDIMNQSTFEFHW